MAELHKPKRSAEALANYERRSGLPLLIVSLLYLVLVLVEILPGMQVGPVFMIIDGAFWLVFVVDYVWRVFFLSPAPWTYAVRPLCLLDLVVVASFPVLLVLGSSALGLARVARIAGQIIRFVRGGAQAARTVGQAHRIFSRRSLRWVLPLALLFVIFAALFVWRFETAEVGGSIDSLGDSLWWAIATMLTVGYGDVVPETPEGRIAGVVLMLVGITVFGWLTASLASLLVENDETQADAELLHKLDEMSRRLAAMEAHMGVLRDMQQDGTPDSAEESADEEGA